ncbi:hypothetical protein KR009_005036 [Drosophila setifemur]|nr:hypothetical protein KR009_005036 [Drosophila setifemur]
MHAQLCIVLLAIGLSQVLAVPAPLALSNHPDATLSRFLMQSRDMNSDAGHSVECLGYYIPLLNDALAKYEDDFKQCLAEAAAKVEGINDETKDERDQIDETATGSCAALTECSQIPDAEKYFQCYTDAGSNSTKTMFTISANASEILAYVREERRLIEVNQFVCTNKTQRTYAEDTADVYGDLSLCLEGAAIPSESSSTAAPTESSTDSSTAAPTESSTDSSSAAPTESSTDSSSAAPTESSTDSSSAAPTESSTDSSSAAPTESSTDSSSAAPTESSTDSSSAAPTESSTDSSSAAPTESSTDSSSAATTASSAPDDAPEEDLKLYSPSENNNLQNILQNLQSWYRSQQKN